MVACDIKLDFDNPQRVYVAGQQLGGKVLLMLRKPKKIKALRLHLVGLAKVEWSKGSGKTKQTYIGREVYLSLMVQLRSSGSADSIVLDAGESQHPFQIPLPLRLPASFVGKHGIVRYTLQAVLERPSKNDVSVMEEFSVATLLDLNREPLAFREPYELAGDAVVTCWCCCACCASVEHGGVDARVTINKRCFVPGESIIVNGQVTSNTSATLSCVRAALKMTVTYKANATYNESKISSSYVVGCEHPNIRGSRTDEWNNVLLLIPALIPSRLDGCKIISIDYTFELWVEVGACKRLVLETKIIIGSIALGGMISSPPPGSAAAITVQPTGTPWGAVNPPSYAELDGSADAIILAENLH